MERELSRHRLEHRNSLDTKMDKRPKTTRRFDDKRALILACATGLINRNGVRGMTLSEVAKSISVVPAGVMYYFKTKEQLAATCYLQGLEQLQEFVTLGEAGADAAERSGLFLSAYFDAERRAALGEGNELIFYDDARALDDSSVTVAYIEMFRSMRHLLVGAALAGYDRPALNARVHLFVSEVLWSPAWLPQSDPRDYSRVASRMHDIMLHGIAAPMSVWAPLPLPQSAMTPQSATVDAREMFLRSATQLINEKGHRAASVDSIAAKLGLTKGAFYHHIKTKDALIVACFERSIDVIWQAIDAAEAVSSSALQTLATVCAALLEYQLLGNVPLLRSNALASLNEATKASLYRKYNRITYRFASILSDGIADGSIRLIDVNLGAPMIMGMIVCADYLSSWVPGITITDAVQLYARPVFDGLLQEPLARRGSTFHS